MTANQEWSPGEFPISYWQGPPEAELEQPFAQGCEPWFGTALTRYQQVAAAGFTFAMPSENQCLPGVSTPALNLKCLAAAEAAGLRVFLQDTRIDAICDKGAPHAVPLRATDIQALDAVIADYRGHPALAGYFLVDEPPRSGSMNPLLAAVVAHFRANDPTHVCFINNLPFPSVDQDYYDRFVLKVRPFTLSYDKYFFQEPPVVDDPTEFLENLNIVRSVALSHDLPFWVIVQAMKHTVGTWRSYRQPTEAEKRFEAMQALAFGAKGVLYFTYWTPDSYGNTVFYPAIVGRNGVPTSQYGGVTRINGDVRAIGRYLLAAQSVMVHDSAAPPAAGLAAPPPAALVRFSYPAAVTVGVFTDATYTYALLANRDYRDGTVGPVTFRTAAVMQLNKSTGTWRNVATHESGRAELLAGAGRCRALQPPRAPSLLQGSRRCARAAEPDFRWRRGRVDPVGDQRHGHCREHCGVARGVRGCRRSWQNSTDSPQRYGRKA
jgi:hypothetical protein